MMGSRKFFVLSMALALALVGSGTALGQQFCSVTAPNGGIEVRAEGLTELVDEIHMICFTGFVAEKTEDYKIVVDFGSAKITNRILANKNTVNDDVTLTMFRTIAAFNAPETGATAAALYPTTSGTTSTHAGDFVRDRAGKLIGGNSAIEFVLSPTTAPSAPATPEVAADGRFALKIKGIRVNAAAVGVGNNVTATISAAGASIFDDNAIVARPAVGLVSKSIGYVRGSSTTSQTTVNAPVQGLACAGSKVLKDLNAAGNEDVAIFDIEVKEGFVNAFQPSNAQNARIRLSFNDIPSGVKVYLRPSPNCDFENGGSGAKRTRVDADSPWRYQKTATGAVAGGTIADRLVLTLKSGLDANGGGEGENAVAPAQGYVQVALSGGSGSMTYEVNGTSHGGDGDDNCDIPIAFVWTSGVDLGSGTVSADFAPLSSAAAAHVDAMVPRFTRSGSAIEAINIEDCATTLLFPFVTNQAGYETGIAISNTSQDTFGTTESSGACEVFFHGSMMGGGAAPSSETSGSIAAGGQWVFGLSQKAAGFQGYLMVRCDFQFAHGLAFITNGFAGVPTLAQSYLALVVPVQHGDRGVGSGGHEMLSN